MTLPTYDQLMLPLMKLLAEQKEAIRISQAADLLASQSNLSEDELNQTLPSGKNIFKDRVSWAKTYLVKAGLVQQPKRAFCEISNLGKSLDLSHFDSITNEFLMQFDGFSDFKLGKSLFVNQQLKDGVIGIIPNEKDASQTPEEIIQTTTELLNMSLKTELL